MNRWVFFITVLLTGPLALADSMTLQNGTSIRGSFQGFSAHQFQFKSQDGAVRSEYGVDVQSLVLDAPVRATVMTSVQRYEDVVFSRYDHKMLRFRKEGQAFNESVTGIKGISVIGPAAIEVAPAPVAVRETGATDAAGVPRLVAPSQAPATRDWQRSGKWREIDDDKSIVISRGEEVELESLLRKGVVNVVHFHYPQAMSSVRQGSYIQGLMARHPGRVVVLKVIARDFNAPVCRALNLKSLPQFWFYSSDSRLVKKLTERFTESDIDAALRDAARN